MGTKTFTFVRFSTTSGLYGEYLLNKTPHRQSDKGVGKYDESPTLPKISWTFFHKRLKIRPEFSLTLTILFCPSPSHTLYQPGFNVAPHSDSKWNGIGFVCSSDLKPEMLSRRAALIGNTLLKLPPFLVYSTFTDYSYKCVRVYLCPSLIELSAYSATLELTISITKRSTFLLSANCLLIHSFFPLQSFVKCRTLSLIVNTLPILLESGK